MPTDSCGPVGGLTQHVSGDEEGETVGYEVNLGNGRHVWCGELSQRSFDEMELDHQEAMGSSFGWFIVLYDQDGRRVLGKAVDEWAARELAEMLGNALLALAMSTPRRVSKNIMDKTPCSTTSEQNTQPSVERVTLGPWYPGHLGDPTIGCECRSIFNEGFAGCIAEVHVDNGITSIGAGGNDCPPYEQAVANMHLIAAAPDLYEACKAALGAFERNDAIDWSILSRALAKASPQTVPGTPSDTPNTGSSNKTARQHWSDCAVNSEPAYPAGECDCGGFPNTTIPPTEGSDGR